MPSTQLVQTVVETVIGHRPVPDACATRGAWAAVLLYLAARDPGAPSLDHLIARHHGLARRRTRLENLMNISKRPGLGRLTLA